MKGLLPFFRRGGEASVLKCFFFPLIVVSEHISRKVSQTRCLKLVESGEKGECFHYTVNAAGFRFLVFFLSVYK